MAYDPKVELRSMAIGAVTQQLLSYEVGLVVISGGEPLSQQQRLVPLVDQLTGRGIEIEVETNGTRTPDDRLIRAGVRFNISPKLSHAGDPAARRIVPQALRKLAGLPSSTFKFVCASTADLDEVAELVQEYHLASVWIMPEGQSREAIDKHTEDLVSEVIDRGWNITTRLHTLVFGQKRGV